MLETATDLHKVVFKYVQGLDFPGEVSELNCGILRKLPNTVVAP